MSTQPATLASFSLPQLIANLQNAFQLAYSGINNALISNYQAGVAKAQATGLPAPAAPLIYVVNSALIATLETQENTAPGSTTAAQWAGVVTQVQYPTIPIIPPAAYTIGAEVGSGLFQLSASGAYPSNGQVIVVNGVDYVAVWAGSFGPVYAQAVGSTTTPAATL